MPRLQVKTFADPDERRTFPKGHAEVVSLDEATVGRSQWEPGWRWTTHLAPVAGTESCQVHHLGLSVSGHLRVETDAATRSTSRRTPSTRYRLATTRGSSATSRG